MSGCDGNSCVDGSCGCRPSTARTAINLNSPKLHVLFTTAEHDMIRERANALGLSMGALVRLAVKAYLRDGMFIPGGKP